MENIPNDSLSILLSNLPKQSLSSLSTTSKTVASNIDLVKKDVTMWKLRVEALTGLYNLPFEPSDNPTEYWKNLATQLDGMQEDPTVLTELFKQGEYEYVYITIKLGLDTLEDTKDALHEAASYGYFKSFYFIVKHSKWWYKLDYDDYAEAAISGGYNDILKLILPHFSENKVWRAPDEESINIIAYSVHSDNIEAFKMILDEYPLTKDKGNLASDILEYIGRMEDEDKVEFLEHFLTTYPTFDDKMNLSSYIEVGNDRIVSSREMELVLNSDIFRIHEIGYKDYLTPEAAYLLYTFEGNYQYPKKNKATLLSVIAKNPTLLDQALSYFRPQNITTLLNTVITNTSQSLNVLIFY